MACPMYNASGFGCGGCCHFNKSTTIALSGTVLRIIIPDQVIQNGQKLCVALCQPIPTGITSSTTVQLVVDGTNIPLITSCGNNVYAAQLRARKVLHVTVATDTNMGVVSNKTCLCPATVGYPILNPTTPATASSVGE